LFSGQFGEAEAEQDAREFEAEREIVGVCGQALFEEVSGLSEAAEGAEAAGEAEARGQGGGRGGKGGAVEIEGLGVGAIFLQGVGEAEGGFREARGEAEGLFESGAGLLVLTEAGELLGSGEVGLREGGATPAGREGGLEGFFLFLGGIEGFDKEEGGG